MAPLLEAQLCDVWGEPLAGGTISQTIEGGGLEVVDPLNDSRTARVTIPIYDRPAGLARPLDRVLAVEYGSHLLFKGPVLQVSTDFEAGTVTMYAHDPTIKLKHHYHRFGDVVVDRGNVSVDGKGMRELIESSLEPVSETESGIPPNGILWGYNSATPHPDIKQKVERGANVWESVLALSRQLVGPDFRFRPVDKHHVGVYPATIFPLGFMVELDTADFLGDDKSGEIIFEHGLGRDNADNIVQEPDGDVVRNRFSYTYPGGQRSRSDVDRIATSRASGSIHDYGIFEGFESFGKKAAKDVIQEAAHAMVQAYARPPQFFTVTPRIDDADTVPRYPRDVRPGDIIRARARKGERDFDELGRINSVRINAVDQTGNVRITLECVPQLDDTVTDVDA